MIKFQNLRNCEKNGKNICRNENSLKRLVNHRFNRFRKKIILMKFGEIKDNLVALYSSPKIFRKGFFYLFYL